MDGGEPAKPSPSGLKPKSSQWAIASNLPWALGAKLLTRVAQQPACPSPEWFAGWPRLTHSSMPSVPSY